MKTLKIEQMLQIDNDFLSAIYRVLPTSVQKDWLDFEKDKWNVFMKFLEKARDRSLQAKLLFSCYEDSEVAKPVWKNVEVDTRLSNVLLKPIQLTPQLKLLMISLRKNVESAQSVHSTIYQVAR